MFASPCSAKHRSSRSVPVALTPRISTPWLRTSRTPASSRARAASATSGVTDATWLACVCTARLTDRAARRARHPRHAGAHLRLEPVLRQADDRLGGQPDVADRLHLQQPEQERLQPGPGHVGDVAAGDHHVAHARRALEVVQHRLLAVRRPQGQPGLGDLRRGGADQVHAGAVPAVLRARGHQLGQRLGRVPAGEALHHPHVRLVQRVALGVRVARPVRVPVGGHRQQVAPDRVGQEGLVVRRRARDHRVQHLRRDQHRHGRVPGPVGVRGRRRTGRSADRRGRRAAAPGVLTLCARCHWALRHSASVTSRQPGSRRQSGSDKRRPDVAVALVVIVLAVIRSSAR